MVGVEGIIVYRALMLRDWSPRESRCVMGFLNR